MDNHPHRGLSGRRIPLTPLALAGLIVVVALSLPNHLATLNRYFGTDHKVPAERLDGFPFSDGGLIEEVAKSSRFNGIFNNRHPVWTPLYSNLYQNATIRKWGCHRNETPLVFVHIGKAGGGKIRARFAASALNYNRTMWHRTKDDNHYYAVSEQHNGSFCNSVNKHWRLPNSPIWFKSFEGNMPCKATTPIGLAMACPQGEPRCQGCSDLTSRHCQTFYVGHNSIGTELHWLTSKYLEEWWKGTPWQEHMPVEWKRLLPHNPSWCQRWRQPRPTTAREYKETFDKCSIPLGRELDNEFNKMWKMTDTASSNPIGHNGTGVEMAVLNYASLYASLPVHRVTVVREPYSWMMSMFFWGGLDRQRNKDGDFWKCDDIATAGAPLPEPGWLYSFCMRYIIYLCGNDCAIRLESGKISLEELEVQTVSNLRQAFSVVGDLSDIAQFYRMVTTRIAYVDTSRNSEVHGLLHASRDSWEARRCKTTFADKEFQAELKARVPVVATLERIYQAAVEVNRFQVEELKQCGM